MRSIKVIRIDGYVTESKLSKALQQLLPDVWMVFVAKTEYRWNMAYEIDCEHALDIVRRRNQIRPKGVRLESGGCPSFANSGPTK